MFNFGKGTLKEQAHLPPQYHLLASIPEKLKHHPSKVRKTADSEYTAKAKLTQKGLSTTKVTKPLELNKVPKGAKKGKEPRKERKEEKERLQVRETEAKPGKKRSLSMCKPRSG